jgi:hypothetical protein
METIEYKLQCVPGRSVQVPKEYSKIAEDIITQIVVEPQEFVKRLFIPSENYRFLRNPGILQSVKDLLSNPSYQKFQDVLYLKICIYGNEQNIKSSDETDIERLRTIDRVLVNTATVIQSTPPGCKPVIK